MKKACTLKDWREICKRAVEDAKAGDHRARDWLTKYVVGEPRPLPDELPHTDAQDNPFKDASDDELLAAMKVFEKLGLSRQAVLEGRREKDGM